MMSDGNFPLSNLFIVSAVIYTADGRYLMQLRDDKPGLPLRDHWAFFGGEVDPGEAPENAIIREVQEELTYLITVVGFMKQCMFCHFMAETLSVKLTI